MIIPVGWIIYALKRLFGEQQHDSAELRAAQEDAFVVWARHPDGDFVVPWAALTASQYQMRRTIIELITAAQGDDAKIEGVPRD